MTLNEFTAVLTGECLVEVIEDGETVAVFDPAYADSIKNEILDLTVTNIMIEAGYLKAPLVKVEATESTNDEDTEPGEEEPDDGEDEPGEEEPDDDDDN